jgi:hypothetical protein
MHGFLTGTVAFGAVALVGAALSDIAKDQIKGVFGTAIPGVAGESCGAREWWARHFGKPPPEDPSRFRVLVARLDNDDGTLTDKVFDAFLDQHGFRVVKTCRSIGLSGMDNIEVATRAAREAEGLRSGRRADPIVWGQVADAGAGAVRLWFSAPSV